MDTPYKRPLVLVGILVALIALPHVAQLAGLHAMTSLATRILIYGIAALCVLLAGLARTFWGFKGAGWYWSQPLLHFKIAVFIVIGLMSLKPTFSFLRWRRKLIATGELPPPQEVRAARRWVMIETHLLGLLLLAAVLLARGVLTRG